MDRVSIMEMRKIVGALHAIVAKGREKAMSEFN